MMWCSKHFGNTKLDPSHSREEKFLKYFYLIDGFVGCGSGCRGLG